MMEHAHRREIVMAMIKDETLVAQILKYLLLTSVNFYLIKSAREAGGEGGVILGEGGYHFES